jgi:aminopeptidase N
VLNVPTSAGATRRDRRGRFSSVALAGALLVGAVGCGAESGPTGSEAPAASESSPATTPGTTGSTGTTTPSAAEEAAGSLDGIGQDDAFPDLGTPLLDVDDYELDLDYDPATGELEGSARLRAELTAASAEVELDFQGLQVESVSVDGDDAPFEQADEKLVIDLGAEQGPGPELTIVVDYAGVPEPVATDALGGVEVGWHGGEDGSFVLSEPEGASTWYPVNNHPLDKATYTFLVTVPDPYSAIANGALLSADPDADAGTTTFEWRMDAPMASYLATVVTGDFAEVDGGEHDGVAYSYWYPTGTEPSAALERTPELVALLADKLGPFPFATYGGVVYPPSFIDGDSGTEQFLSGVALETQGRSLFAEGSTVPSVIIHEAAHQWMGDNVSITDWSRDIWWVEGFAHFAEYVEDPDQLADLEPEIRSQWRPPGDIPVDELFFGCSYECGAIVFYALYREVGEDVFWEILREFNGRYYLANASTDDLIDVASDVSGTDLADFFDAWLFDPKPPKLPA